MIQAGGPERLALTAVAATAGSGTPTLSLWAASGATVDFVARNGQPTGGLMPEARIIPRLVLRRNGNLASAGERSLVVELSGLEVPSPGLTVTLQLETFHGDPDRGGGFADRIVVWREARWIPGPARSTQGATVVTFRHEFEEELSLGISTPTDYLRLKVFVLAASRPGTRLLFMLREDYAVLLENEWLVALPDVLEEADGAAPGELLIYYCDTFPTRRSGSGSESWLRRDEISAFVARQFVPAAVDAFRLQADVWQFPWYLAWTPYDPAGTPERLVVALAPAKTWYHGYTPANGNARISINLDEAGRGYETFLDGVMSTFHHELFHNLQRSLYQHFGLAREGDWDMVTEGMAMLASSVAQPEIQFRASRAYLAAASDFFNQEGPTGDAWELSYVDSAYKSAPYWRFLYEQCAVGDDGAEDPAAGIGVMRRTLAALYTREAAHPLSRAEFVEAFPEIMDEALSGSPCPFQSFEASQLAFARAIYALRLDGERCREVSFPSLCGLYDPNDLYPRPAAKTVLFGHQATLRRAGQSYLGAVHGSYGIDLVDVVLDPAARSRPLTVELFGGPQGAEFRLEVWKLRQVRELVVPASAVPGRANREPDGSLSYTLSELDTEDYNWLGLIITRVDNRERRNTRGSYALLLR